MKKTLQTPYRNLPSKESTLGIIAASLLALTAGDASAQHFGSAFRIGNTGNDEASDIARDSDGNLYVTGHFAGTVDFDPGPGVLNLTSAGSADGFVAKYDHDNKLLWAKRMGSSDFDFAEALALDSAGNVVITGSFKGTVDFDPGAAVFDLTSAGRTDSFVWKLSSNGTFVWAKRFGGADSQTGRDITVDSLGNVLSIGEFVGIADFDPGANTVNLVATQENDIYVSKLNGNGVFLWAKRLGGGGNDQGYSIAVDSAGNVLSTGTFSDTGDFDPGFGVFNMTATLNDVFVSKLNSNGVFVWAKRFGANLFDEGYSIAVDAAGNAITTGTFGGTADFDPGAGVFNLTSNGAGDSFISVLSSNGAFLWATNFDGDSGAVTFDSLGNILVTGHFSGTADFDPSAETFSLTSAGERDIFISKFDAFGNFAWARRMGGTGDEFGYAIVTDAVSANVWTSGMFSNTVDFDPGSGVFNLTAPGAEGIFEMFVCRLTTHSKVLWSDEEGNAVLMTVDGCGNKVGSKEFSASGFVAMSYDRTGEDALGHLLWSDQDSGKAMLWLLKGSADEFAHETKLENKPGWKAMSHRTSIDGTGKILWEHKDGRKEFWTVDLEGNRVCATQSNGAAGWTVRSFTR